MKRTKKKIDVQFIILVCACFLALIGTIVSATSILGTALVREDSPPIRLNSATVGTGLSAKNGYISFLGDSITTYEGWSNNTDYNTTIGNNAVYYTSSKMGVTDTWWHQTANELDYGLCVNNSWSAGRVTDTKDGILSGVERASNLHNDNTNVKPDVIVVYLGTNDIGNGISSDDFNSSYAEMLNVIKSAYPEAEVYCCTLLPESRTEGMDSELAAYNEIIRDLTESAGYNVIDFYESITDWDYTTHTYDDNGLRVHPTANGMDKLAECVIETIKG